MKTTIQKSLEAFGRALETLTKEGMKEIIDSIPKDKNGISVDEYFNKFQNIILPKTDESIEKAFKKLYKDNNMSWDNFDKPIHPLYSAYQNFKAGVRWREEE